MLAARVEGQYVRDVPYFNQRLNKISPAKSCQNSIAAMLLSYFGATSITPDAISKRWGISKAQTVYGWEIVFNAEAEERDLRYRDNGVDDGRLSSIHKILDNGTPVGVHGSFTNSGHLIILLGYDEQYYYVHDPYGDWNKGYDSSDLDDGRHARYPRNELEKAIQDFSTGNVRYHEFVIAPGHPSIVVENSTTDSIISGGIVNLTIEVRTQPTAIEKITADLTKINGSKINYLSYNGDGLYSLTTTIDLTNSIPGRKKISIDVSAKVKDIPHQFRVSHSIYILPPQDQYIFDDGWNQGWTSGVLNRTEIDTASTRKIYSGKTSLEVVSNFFNMQIVATDSINHVGYESLRFVFHPGDITTIDQNTFFVYVNNDIRTVINLLNTPARKKIIDFSKKTWQIIEIPLINFIWPEKPIKSLHFFGKLEGTFYIDELQLIPAKPNPLSIIWTEFPVHAFANTSKELDIGFRMETLASDNSIPQTNVDLSELGGHLNVPMNYSESDSTFRLRTKLNLPHINGQKNISFSIQQVVEDKTWNLNINRLLKILPQNDLKIFNDNLNRFWHVKNDIRSKVDLNSTNQVSDGKYSMGIEADNFTINFKTTEPVDTTGFKSLHFSFHYGTLIEKEQNAFNISINGDSKTSVSLFPTKDATGYLSSKSYGWESVNIPLDDFGSFEGPLESIRMLGNLQGIFYLDDIRLTCALPYNPSTAVTSNFGLEKESISISSNGSNPFNGKMSFDVSQTINGFIFSCIYNAAGQQIRVLKNSFMSIGVHRVEWDGRDYKGHLVASGVYFFHVRNKTRRINKKMLLLR